MAKKTESSTIEKKKSTSNVDLQKFLKEVETRAYELYEKRVESNAKGDEFSDWLKAEADIKAKYKII
jgi:hypothetical protein